MSRSFSSTRLFFFSAALALGVLLAPIKGALSQSVPNDGFDPAVIDRIAASLRQVPLTEDMVNRLIASYPDMRAVGGKFAATQLPDHPPAIGSGVSGLDALPADKRREMEATATKHGFTNLDEWAAVASSVVMSYVYAMQGKRPGALEEAVKLNIAQAQNDTRMTEEQKQQTIAQYRELGVKLARLEPLKENFELVVRMKDKVAPLIDPD